MDEELVREGIKSFHFPFRLFPVLTTLIENLGQTSQQGFVEPNGFSQGLLGVCGWGLLALHMGVPLFLYVLINA